MSQSLDDEWSAKSVEALKAGDIGALGEQLRALPPELLQQAIQTAHELGNRAFKDKAYYEAIDQYTSTLTGDPQRVAAWSNRAACFTATKQHDKALRDAQMCVRLKPDWPKAHYRLGRALLGIGGDRTAEAVAAFAKGCGLDPNNAEMQKWHRQAHTAWKAHVLSTGKVPKPRSFDSQAFDKMVKEHEAEEKVINDAIEQQAAVDNMQFERPDGTIMSKKEAEAMLTGQDPNAGPRGDQYKATFDTALLQGVGADDIEDDAEQTEASKREYVAAEKFEGAREGFVFTTGPRGLGYYEDMGPEAAGAPGLSTADEVAQTKKKATHRDSAAVKALRSYMQDVSELQVPTWQICALGDTELLSVFCRTIERLHIVAPPTTRWLHLGTGTCVPLMKTVSLCGVPFLAGDAAGATNRNDMRELLESVGLLQLYGLFEDEEMTDSDTLVQMIPQPEQLREALKEVGVSKIGHREKIVAALKQKGAETGRTGRQNAVRVTVRHTHVHEVLSIACIFFFPFEKGTLAPQACTGHSASYIFSVVHRVLTHNSMRKGVQLLHRRIEDIELVENPGAQQLGLGTPQRGSFLEEARRATLASRADVCIIDAEYFDEGLIGKRVLPILAHAKRNLLTASAKIVPAAASLHAELLQVKCSEDAATGFDLSMLDKYRWSPCYEKFRVEEQPDGTVLRCSDAVPLLNFDLQGMPAEKLVAGGRAEVTITATQTARVNGVLLWFRLDMDGEGLVVVGSEPCASGESSTAKSGNVGGRTWSQAIQWLVPPVNVQAGQSLTISTVFSATRVRCDVTPVVATDSGGASFAPGRPAYRAQCEQYDEVLLQCSASGHAGNNAAALHIFDTTPERGFIASFVIGDTLKRWESKQDDEGDEVLVLTTAHEKASDTTTIELEAEGASRLCKTLSELKKGCTVQPTVDRLSGTLARWHYDLIADSQRNNAYNDAIERQVKRLIRRRKNEKTAAWYNKPDAKSQKRKPNQPAAMLAGSPTDGRLVEVLSLGCGSGLLSMMAVRASEKLGEMGAVHVTGQDRSENLLNTAAEIVASNGYGRHMTLVNKDSRTMTVGETIGGVTPELKRRADLLILENFDYGLLGEGVLPILHHACAVLLTSDAIVIPAVARIFGMLVEHRPTGPEHTVEGFNVDLWRTYLCRPEYMGYNVRAEIGAGRMRPLSAPFQAFEFDLNNVAKPKELGRAERLAALAQCEAAAHPEFDCDAPDPDNMWGPLKSALGQEAMVEGDLAFKDGRMIEALQAYQKMIGMEPVNQPAQARLRAAKRALGFPGDERKMIDVPIETEGIANSVVFWFELQMEADRGGGEDAADEAQQAHDENSAPATISTSPLICPRLGSHWLQACQALEEIRVAKGDALPIEAALGEAGASARFSIARNSVAAPPYGERRTSVPPVDPLWIRAQQEAEQKMKKIEQLVVSSAEGHQQAAEAAAAIAVDPGRGGPEAIDPQRANVFALSFHH